MGIVAAKMRKHMAQNMSKVQTAIGCNNRRAKRWLLEQLLETVETGAGYALLGLTI